MPYELRDGQGSLFPNSFKEDGDNKPDYKGTALIGVVLYEVAAWRKSGTKGEFLSLSIKPKEERPSSNAPPPARTIIQNQEIPF